MCVSSITNITNVIRIIFVRTFLIRRNQNKVNSMETVYTVITLFFVEVIKKIAVHQAFLIIDDKVFSLLLHL